MKRRIEEEEEEGEEEIDGEGRGEQKKEYSIRRLGEEQKKKRV